MSRTFFPHIHLRLSARIALVVAVSQALLYASFAFLLMQGNTQVVTASEQNTFRLLGNTIQWLMEHEFESARLSIAGISENKTVLGYMAAGDREKLYENLLPLYNRIQNRVPRIHFYTDTGTLFLQMHDSSEMNGTELAARPMLLDVLTLRSSITGIERGKNGLSLRIIEPLFLNGTFVGAVEYCLEFGSFFLDKIRQKFDGFFYLYSADPDGGIEIICGTHPVEICAFTEHALDCIFTGEDCWLLDCERARAVGLYPFRDYQGAVAGFFKVEFQRIPMSQSYSAIVDKIFYMGIFMTASLVLLIFSIIMLMLRPLRAVVRKTKEISDRIISGDIGFRGDVESTAQDFRDIIEAVNGIIMALRERQTLLQAIVEGVPGIVYYVNRQRKLLWANRRTKAEFPGIEEWYCNKKDENTGFMAGEEQLLEQAFGSGKIETQELCYTRAVPGNGKQECWEHVAVPVKDHDGEVGHVIRISRDVTDKHNAQDQLLKLNEELENRVRDEIARREEGERLANQHARLAAIGELATGMAHEITQPLNAVAFTVENLVAWFRNGNGDPEYLERKRMAMNDDIERVRRVIDHVREFSRSTPEAHTARFSINAAVDHALSLLGVQLATHGVDLVREFSDMLPDALGNPYQYEQVVLNLLSNARDALEERRIVESCNDSDDPCPARIRIRTWAEDGIICLEIADNGSGIPAEKMSRIFDPFFTTKAPGKGTGLGLSISFGIIRKMNGTLICDTVNRETVFTVRIPAEEG